MNTQAISLQPEIFDWCNARIARQPRRHNSWTPFVVQIILDHATQHNPRPDIDIVRKLWSDFEHGVVPKPKMEIVQ